MCGLTTYYVCLEPPKPYMAFSCAVLPHPWKVALAGVNGLPDCPSDLTEPQWAHLLFDTYCHFCAGPSIKAVFWHCRVSMPFVHQNTPRDIGRNCGMARNMLSCVTDMQLKEHCHMILIRLKGDLENISAFIEQKRSETNILRQHVRLCEDWQHLSQCVIALRSS
ncbi:hypothetical protein FIBSPDRAFT_520307 [Athelia psychrophila]|uniref:Uncharacterized protein n=1 Tax=Athelia psychrophila TaxID=1759441 RepID=A0A166JSU1_9AGAM|nr:hypothetical protein FIBSPDRAFT_520307 [Fibularhizoctonia sp. CBS 109695]